MVLQNGYFYYAVQNEVFVTGVRQIPWQNYDDFIEVC
jgi:hypothetical protein